MAQQRFRDQAEAADGVVAEQIGEDRLEQARALAQPKLEIWISRFRVALDWVALEWVAIDRADVERCLGHLHAQHRLPSVMQGVST